MCWRDPAGYSAASASAPGSGLEADAVGQTQRDSGRDFSLDPHYLHDRFRHLGGSPEELLFFRWQLFGFALGNSLPPFCLEVSS